MRIFTLDDQIAFAKLSGDSNPMHIDAIAARRTMFGAPVVHGIHGVLYALDRWLETTRSQVEFCSIKATFYKPIKVGDEVQLDILQEGEASLLIRLFVGKSIATKITTKWAFTRFETNRGDIPVDIPTTSEPRILSDEEIAHDSGSIDIPLNIECARALFPYLVDRMSPTQVATILHLSRLVGVQCPGLHSLFSEFELSKADDIEDRCIHYQVARFDRRIGLVTINISAPQITGVVKAFRRPEPKDQASYPELQQHVLHNEFSNQHALIIGGSRGLGEVAAKFLAAGGADVKITYSKGKSDAEKIVADIVSHGGTADCFRYDVLNPSICEKDISPAGWKPTHLYYFATPFIFSGVKGVFSPELFREFCDYYVVGFINALNLLSDYDLKKVFYPSTVAVDELPKNMGEYASAKIAGELLCEFLEKCLPGITVYKSRFPRVATDQTVSIIPVKNEDPAVLMLNELRAFQLKSG